MGPHGVEKHEGLIYNFLHSLGNCEKMNQLFTVLAEVLLPRHSILSLTFCPPFAQSECPKSDSSAELHHGIVTDTVS